MKQCVFCRIDLAEDPSRGELFCPRCGEVPEEQRAVATSGAKSWIQQGGKKKSSGNSKVVKLADTNRKKAANLAKGKLQGENAKLVENAASESIRANLSEWESKSAREEYAESGYKELMSDEFLCTYKTLMPHQKEAVAWLIESYVSMFRSQCSDSDAAREGGVLLAHDAGLGKTITVDEN